MIRLSKRPGLNSAGSKISGRFVAANRTSPLLLSNPSISARSWFSVCSLSSLLPIWLSRLLPIASISSMKMIHGAICCACLNRSRTREAPTPTYISTKAEPLSEKNGTFASPATAFAPTLVYFPGLCRKSTTSCRDSFASSCPATSLNVTPVCFSTYILALLLPIPIMPPPLDIRFVVQMISATRHATGRNVPRSWSMTADVVSGIFALYSTCALYSLSDS